MAQLPDTGRSRAVLVGAGRYQLLSELGSVHNNLSALAGALRDERVWGLPYGNCVVVKDPAVPPDILAPIAEAAREATDTLVLYYAGHGLVDPRRGELHLALADSDPQQMWTAVWYSLIRDLLLDSRATRKIVILDCCYSGRALGQMSSAGDAVATEAIAEGTYVLTAAAENKAAVAPPGAHFTAFTGELLSIFEHGISGEGPLLDLDSIYRELLAAMHAKGYPRPQKRDRNTAGQLTLIRNQAYRPALVKRIATPMPAVGESTDSSRSASDAPVSSETVGTTRVSFPGGRRPGGRTTRREADAGSGDTATTQTAAQVQPRMTPEPASPAPAIGEARTSIQPGESITTRADLRTLPEASGTETSAPSPRASGEAGHAALTRDLTIRLTGPLPADETSSLPVLLAEWALWGKDERNTDYHVMRCSKGDLAAADFSEIITRYGAGVKPSLPQYTVCWIPGPQDDPEYLAVEIYEVIEPGSPSAGGRSRNVGGRVVEYVRMFCFRYADVAQLEASYSQLVKAVADIPLVGGEGPAGLITVELPPGLEPIVPAGAERQLAEDVALALLTGSPVCVLDADGVAAERRLAFIDSVLSLLPFGLRATLAASTWASTTLQNLKLRLYFSDAPREDHGRTSHMTWGRPGSFRIPQGHAAARLYQEWLREAGQGAIGQLAHLTVPVRFTEAEELQMLASLPDDKSIAAETLEELSVKLRVADQHAVSAIVRRLKRYLASPQSPADRAVCRSLMLEKYLLFRDHAKIHGRVKASVYRTLLSLGFEKPLSYAAYCEIEESVGGQPDRALRNVLLETKSNVLPYVLAALAGPGVGYAELGEVLAIQDVTAAGLLDILEREMDQIRPRHRRDLIDFTLRYLAGPANLDKPLQTAKDPRTELFSRGYLTSLLNRAFPKDQAEQQRRLADILRYVYGERLGPRQIRRIFEAPQLYPGPAFEAAVKGLARLWHRPLVERQAAVARMRYASHADEADALMHSTQRGAGTLSETAFTNRWYVFAALPVFAAMVAWTIYAVLQLF